MPYPPKPPTSQAVSAALRRAGFDRVEFFGSARDTTAGYKVRGVRDVPHVVVTWHPSSRDLGPQSARRTRHLLRYADVLLQAGFRSRIDEPGGKLTVHGRWR